MDALKKIRVKYFYDFTYFYNHLRHRVFFIVFLSIAVGLLDGLGLTMFLPLLQMVGESQEVSETGLGKLSFILDFLEKTSLPLSLGTVLFFMSAFFILKGIALYFQGYYQVVVQQYFIRKIRVENILSLNALSYKYFIQADIGQIQNTLTGEVDRVAKAFDSYFLAFQQTIMVLVYMGFAFFVDAQFAVLVSLGGIFTNFIFKVVYKKTKEASKYLTQETNSFQGLIIQHVNNFKYLKATGLIHAYGNRLVSKVDEIQEAGKRIGALSAILKGSREPLIIVVVSTVIMIQVKVLNAALGPILVSLLFFYRALVAVMATQTAWNYFLGNSGSLENMKIFTNSLKKHREKTQNEYLPIPKKCIELKNISLSFKQNEILKNINLTIPKNKTVAFIGESGSGKTTLVNVITGLLPLTKGQIFIDDTEVISLNNQAYQREIGYVTQEPVIFNDTIFNNITLWAEKSKNIEIRFRQAIKDAAIEDFINSLDFKENTLLGNNGVNLSGGQRQRISIARELFKEVSILILDEATSALDSETEKAIQKSIDYLKGQYTILAIAHRLSTVRDADIVVFMKEGHIVDIGTFDNLSKSLPDFKRMVELQEI